MGYHTNTYAVYYGEVLSDPDLQSRANVLYAHIRCPTCAGQSLESSPTAMAQELRAIIRQQLKQGYTDDQIIDFLKQQYGEDVSFDPQVSWYTSLLWGLPLVLIAFGIIRVILWQRSI